jgi:acyl-coenzyme A thioesterase PaaI-like protein
MSMQWWWGALFSAIIQVAVPTLALWHPIQYPHRHGRHPCVPPSLLPSHNTLVRLTSMTSSSQTNDPSDDASDHLNRERTTNSYSFLDDLQNKDRYRLMPLPSRSQLSSHIVGGHLHKPGLVEDYRVYQCLCNGAPISYTSSYISSVKDELAVVKAYIQLGSNLDGHPGIVHGGILALLLDDVLGYAYETLDIPMAVTANLSVDFRMAVPAGSTVQVQVYLISWQERKLSWKVHLMAQTDPTVLYCEATSLYVIPRAVYDTMNDP